MDMGSDGSLCRVTSSAAAHNNAVIVKSESESEKSKGTPYKIVIIGIIQNPHESSPEVESEEEIDEKVSKEIEQSIGNGEKANTSSDKKTAVNEFKGNGSCKANRGYHRYSSNNNFKNRRPNKPFRNHHNSSNKRNPYPKKKPSNNYPKNSSNDISPWAVNPNTIIVPNYPSYSAYAPFPVTSPIEPHIPKRHNCESSAIGILGDRPFSRFPPHPPPHPPPPPPPHYPSRDPNVPEQNWNDQTDYWNGQTDMQNYWDDGRSNNYQRPIPTDRPVSEPKQFHRGKHFQLDGYWRRGNAHR